MDICVWNKCNNRCVMCTNPEDFWESNVYTREFLEKRLSDLGEKIKAEESILLTGGEPTIHPQFLEVLQFARANCPACHIDLLSNGRRFFYGDFTREVMKISDMTIAVALHGFSDGSHDRITRSPGSFKQTIGGLKNILNFRNSKLRQIVEIRVVVHKLNYQQLPEILCFIKRKLSVVDRVVLIFMEVEGQGSGNFKKIGLKYSQFHPYFRKIERFVRKFNNFRLYHFPLCVVPQIFWPYTWRTLPASDVRFLDFCKKCLYKRFCLGIPVGYLAKVGSIEFKPIKETVKIKSTSNSHHPIDFIKK